MAELKSVTDDTFDAEVVDATQPVIVDFWATWCVPCKTIAPCLEKLADRFEGRVRVVKIEAEGNARTAARLQVRSVPTVVAFKNGQEVERQTGVRSLSTFCAMADKLIDEGAS
ncbi:MAG: thioredoxin [bacterium]|nr:thioredoxin [bacterium]